MNVQEARQAYDKAVGEEQQARQKLAAAERALAGASGPLPMGDTAAQLQMQAIRENAPAIIQAAKAELALASRGVLQAADRLETAKTQAYNHAQFERRPFEGTAIHPANR